MKGTDPPAWVVLGTSGQRGVHVGSFPCTLPPALPLGFTQQEGTKAWVQAEPQRLSQGHLSFPGALVKVAHSVQWAFQ